MIPRILIAFGVVGLIIFALFYFQPNNLPLNTTVPLPVINMDAPLTARVYQISEGVVSYTVIKTTVGQADSLVVGTTDRVRGSGWVDYDTNSSYFEAFVDLSALKTDDAKRDRNVQDLLSSKVASLDVSLDNIESFKDVEFENVEVSGNLTLAGITKEVVFLVSGLVTGEDFNLTGNADILLSDFGIVAPSVVGVIQASDLVSAGFDIAGVRVVE